MYRQILLQMFFGWAACVVLEPFIKNNQSWLCSLNCVVRFAADWPKTTAAVLLSMADNLKDLISRNTASFFF